MSITVPASPERRRIQVEQELSRIAELKRTHGEDSWQAQGRGRCLRCPEEEETGHDVCPQFVNKKGRLLCEYCGCVLAMHVLLEEEEEHEEEESNSNSEGNARKRVRVGPEGQLGDEWHEQEQEQEAARLGHLLKGVRSRGLSVAIWVRRS